MIKILTQTPSELVLSAGPDSVEIGAAVVITLLLGSIIVAMLVRREFRGWKRLWLLLPIGIGLINAPLAYWEAGMTRTLVLSRITDTLRYTDRWFGKLAAAETLPLERVECAVVQRSRGGRVGGGRRLVIVLKDDRELYPLGIAFTDIPYAAACEAINSFLRVRGPGDVPLCR